MKIIYPKNQIIKTTKIPNTFLFNRLSFGIMKIFLVTKSLLFIKIKYKQIKPALKMIKNYNDFEIVNIKTRQGDEIRILL